MPDRGVMMEPPSFQYEAEQRWLVSNKEELRRRLRYRGAVVLGELHVTDDWFVPARIQTYRQHNNWLRTDHAAPIRIRTVQGPTRNNARLEVKRPIASDTYNISREISVGITDGGSARRILEELGLRCLITLEKQRTIFRINDLYECNVDEYSDDSTILELEVLSTEQSVVLPDTLRRLGRTLAGGIAAPLPKSAAIYFIDRKLKGQPL